MSKPTPQQLSIINAIFNELDYWTTSNDIHSPSHGTSIESDMFANLPDEVIDEHAADLREIENKVGEIHGILCSISPCPIREQQRKSFTP